MPDWIHALVYMVIVIAVALAAGYYTQNILGLFAGLGLAHFLASAIIKLIPGFWGNQ
ncbi:MAG: hypothetical protein R6U91_03170 [Bacillota bacterium]